MVDSYSLGAYVAVRYSSVRNQFFSIAIPMLRVALVLCDMIITKKTLAFFIVPVSQRCLHVSDSGAFEQDIRHCGLQTACKISYMTIVYADAVRLAICFIDTGKQISQSINEVTVFIP